MGSQIVHDGDRPLLVRRRKLRKEAHSVTKRLKVILSGRPLWMLTAIGAAFVGGILTPVSVPIRGPLVDINDTILIAILVALGGFVAQLYLRMGKLESDLAKFREENDGLRADLTAAVSFIDRLGLWIAAGMPPTKMPRPAKRLEDHIDAELWVDDPAVGGTD